MTPPPSDHFNGKTFFQPHHARTARRLDLLRWKLTSKAKPWPQRGAVAPIAALPPPKDDAIAVTWLGHASFLLRTPAGNFLIDPVFSDRVSPVSWAGPRRFHPPPLALADLPKIDAVFVSHDHYDHFDAPTLRALVRRFQPRFVTPLRHRDLLERIGAQHLDELDWFETVAIAAGCTVTLTPTQHWSNRLGTPRNHRLWGGFFLHFQTAGAANPTRVWFVGDTGYAASIVRDVRARCGTADLALVPIGAYEPRWFMSPMHMNPAEAVQWHRESGARKSLGMHWGTFALSDEGYDTPLQDLAAASRAAGLHPSEFVTISPGESLSLESVSASAEKC